MNMLGKVLIVEDDLFLQDFYRIFFRKIGGSIIILEDGLKIIQEVENGNVDLIVMDINLRNTYLNSEKMDGVKLSRYIKMNFTKKSIPILLITAYPISSIADNMLAESMADDYLIKPITDFNLLVQKINKLVYEHTER
jgi:CheY-like chemotaxis protein